MQSPCRLEGYTRGGAALSQHRLAVLALATRWSMAPPLAQQVQWGGSAPPHPGSRSQSSADL